MEPDQSATDTPSSLSKDSYLRDEKFVTAMRSYAGDFGHKLKDSTIKTVDEKQVRIVTLKFERSISGQEELALSTEREADDVPTEKFDDPLEDGEGE